MEPMKPTTSETASALTAQEAAGNSGDQSHSETSSTEETDRRERFNAGSSASGQRGGSLPEHPGGTGRDSSRVNSSGPDQAASEENDLEDRWYQLEFIIARSLRYHAKRRAFFERCNQMTRALSAIFSAGAIISVVKHSEWATIASGAIVGIANALDLVFDFSKRAMVYDDLYRRFADLGIKLALTERSDECYRQFVKDRLLIEKEEPTLLVVLNAICYNEELKARGYDFLYRISPAQKLLRHFFDIREDDIQRIPHKA